MDINKLQESKDNIIKFSSHSMGGCSDILIEFRNEKPDDIEVSYGAMSKVKKDIDFKKCLLSDFYSQVSTIPFLRDYFFHKIYKGLGTMPHTKNNRVEVFYRVVIFYSMSQSMLSYGIKTIGLKKVVDSIKEYEYNFNMTVQIDDDNDTD